MYLTVKENQNSSAISKILCYRQTNIFLFLKSRNTTLFYVWFMIYDKMHHYLDPVKSGLVMEWLTVKWQLGIVTTIK